LGGPNDELSRVSLQGILARFMYQESSDRCPTGAASQFLGGVSLLRLWRNQSPLRGKILGQNYKRFVEPVGDAAIRRSDCPTVAGAASVITQCLPVQNLRARQK